MCFILSVCLLMYYINISLFSFCHLSFSISFWFHSSHFNYCYFLLIAYVADNVCASVLCIIIWNFMYFISVLSAFVQFTSFIFVSPLKRNYFGNTCMLTTYSSRAIETFNKMREENEIGINLVVGRQFKQDIWYHAYYNELLCICVTN